MTKLILELPDGSEMTIESEVLYNLVNSARASLEHIKHKEQAMFPNSDNQALNLAYDIITKFDLIELKKRNK